MYLTPRSNDRRLDQMMTAHEVLASKRVLFLYGALFGYPIRTDPFSPSLVADTMLAMASISNDPIYLVLESEGGVVRDGYTVLDVMQTIKAPVYTVGRSCYSMAAVLLAAGEKGHRYIFPNSRVMLHLPSGGFQGDAKEIAIQAKETERTKDQLVDTLLANGVKSSRKKLLADIDREHWMTAEEAISYGIADQVVPRGFFEGVLDVRSV